MNKDKSSYLFFLLFQSANVSLQWN